MQQQRREASLLLLEAPTSFASVADLVELIYEFVGTNLDLVKISGVNHLWRRIAFGSQYYQLLSQQQEEENSGEADDESRYRLVTTNGCEDGKTSSSVAPLPTTTGDKSTAAGFFDDFPELLNGIYLDKLLNSFEGRSTTARRRRVIDGDGDGNDSDSEDYNLLPCLENDCYPRAIQESDSTASSRRRTVCLELFAGIIALLTLAAPSIVSVAICSEKRCNTSWLFMVVIFLLLCIGIFAVGGLYCLGLERRTRADLKNLRCFCATLITVLAITLSILGVYLAANGGFTKPQSLLHAVETDPSLDSIANCVIIEDPQRWYLGDFALLPRAMSRDPRDTADDSYSSDRDVLAYLTLMSIAADSTTTAATNPVIDPKTNKTVRVPVLFDAAGSIGRVQNLAGYLSTAVFKDLSVRLYNNNESWTTGVDTRPVAFLRAQLSDRVYDKTRLEIRKSYCFQDHSAAVMAFCLLWGVAVVLFIIGFFPMFALLICSLRADFSYTTSKVVASPEGQGRGTTSASSSSRRPIATYSWYESLAVSQRLNVAKGSRSRLQKGCRDSRVNMSLEEMRRNMIANQQQRSSSQVKEANDDSRRKTSRSGGKGEDSKQSTPGRFKFNYSPEIQQKLTLAEMRAASKGL